MPCTPDRAKLREHILWTEIQQVAQSSVKCIFSKVYFQFSPHYVSTVSTSFTVSTILTSSTFFRRDCMMGPNYKSFAKAFPPSSPTELLMEDFQSLLSYTAAPLNTVRPSSTKASWLTRWYEPFPFMLPTLQPEPLVQLFGGLVFMQ